MNCIVAVDKKFGIGKGNKLLFHIPKDMENFKSKTSGKIVVMGKNTLLSLPKSEPLAQRTNIVLSKTLSRSDCIVCSDLVQLSEILKNYNSDDVFVIGGEMVYSVSGGVDSRPAGQSQNSRRASSVRRY